MPGDKSQFLIPKKVKKYVLQIELCLNRPEKTFFFVIYPGS
jgi:hypothetical protein